MLVNVSITLLVSFSAVFLAAFLRDYHQKRKTQIDTIHSLMDKIETIMDTMIDELKTVKPLACNKYPLAKNLQLNSATKVTYFKELEQHRLISVAREKSLRRAFEEIKAQDPKLYSVPYSKLNELKKAIGDYYDNPSKPQSLAKIVHCKNELLYSFNRQPFIWLKMLF